MRKILLLITSVRVKILLNLYERLLDSFCRAIAWDQLKFIIGEIKRIRKITMLITSVRVKIQLNLYERSLDSSRREIAWDQ